MLKMSKLSKGCTIALSLSVMSFASGSIMAAECGPGDHWVDDCPAGTDEANSSATIKIQMGSNCDGKEITEILSGPTEVKRGAGDDTITPHTIGLIHSPKKSILSLS
jgi:hypothetical protein